MAHFDGTILTLSLDVDMVSGHFHILFTPLVIKSLSRSVKLFDEPDSVTITRLINDLEEKLTEDDSITS